RRPCARTTTPSPVNPSRGSASGGRSGGRRPGRRPGSPSVTARGPSVAVPQAGAHVFLDGGHLHHAAKGGGDPTALSHHLAEVLFAHVEPDDHAAALLVLADLDLLRFVDQRLREVLHHVGHHRGHPGYSFASASASAPVSASAAGASASAAAGSSA